jgi:hypothetical protein
LFSYARVYCIHIHNARRELVFYQLAKEGIVKRLSIHLHAQGTVFLHTIDNLLITHHVEQKVPFYYVIILLFVCLVGWLVGCSSVDVNRKKYKMMLFIVKVSMLFDIRARNPEENTIPFPLAAPLPLAPFTLPANYHSLHSYDFTNNSETNNSKQSAITPSNTTPSTSTSLPKTNSLNESQNSIKHNKDNNNSPNLIHGTKVTIDNNKSNEGTRPSQRKSDNDTIITYELCINEQHKCNKLHTLSHTHSLSFFLSFSPPFCLSLSHSHTFSFQTD